MRCQPRKRKKHNEPIVILSLLAIAIYIVAIDSPDKQYVRALHPDTEYKTLEYVITEVNGNEYYGKSVKDDTGIYFTVSEIKGDQETINVNDRIVAYFEPSDLIKMVKVEKINE